MADKFQRRCTHWRNVLWLNNYQLDFEHDSDRDDDGNWETVASVRVKPEYRRATVTYNPKVTSDMKAEEMDKAALHEMVHVLLGPMMNHAQDVFRDTMAGAEYQANKRAWLTIVEGVTSHITDVIYYGDEKKR